MQKNIYGKCIVTAVDIFKIKKEMLCIYKLILLNFSFTLVNMWHELECSLS